jgi:hypothetical protein
MLTIFSARAPGSQPISHMLYCEGCGGQFEGTKQLKCHVKTKPECMVSWGGDTKKLEALVKAEFHRRRSKRAYMENKEKETERKRAEYNKDPDKERERKQSSYVEDPIKQRERKRSSYVEDPSKERERIETSNCLRNWTTGTCAIPAITTSGTSGDLRCAQQTPFNAPGKMCPPIC